MFKRTTAVLATVIAALMAVGIASAAIGPSSDDSTSPTSITTVPSSALPDPVGAETVVYEVGDAGFVTVTSEGSTLSIVVAEAAEGWTAEIEVASGPEVEADFRNGTRRIQFNAELEDGQVKVRVRERADDNVSTDSSMSTATTTPDDSSTTPTTTPDDSSTPSTTIPDDSSTTSTTVPTTGDASASSVTYTAGDGGTVTVASNGSSLTIVSVNAAAGWSYEVEVAAGLEVEADFRNGTRRIQFNAQLEDGEVRIRVRSDNNG